MVPQWFEPTISREDAEIKLEHKFTGNFLIRQSSQPGTLALSVKIGRRKNDIQHFIILSREGSVALEDSELEFDSLVSLVNYYSKNRDELPVSLKIMDQHRKMSAPAGFTRGDSPYVSMVGRQRTKSTIWVNSPVFRTAGDTKARDLEVIQSVLRQGSNIQDQFSSLLNDCLSTKEEFDRLSAETDPDYVEEGEEGAPPPAEYNLTRIVVNQCDAWTPDKINNHRNQKEKKLEPTKNIKGVKMDYLKVPGEDSPQVRGGESPDNEDYEDYSLPIDLATNVYEVPDMRESRSTPSLTQMNKSNSNLPSMMDTEGRLSPRGDGPGYTEDKSLSSSHLQPHRRASSCTATGPASAETENRPFRYRKNNSTVENQYRPIESQVSSNLSKSCSNIFEELERRNLEHNKHFRKSFVRKVSLNLSVRRNNNIQPIRKISSVMKKMFPVPKSLSSLVNHQENSDSWEYLADCGVSPVYEEVKDVRRPTEDRKKEDSTGEIDLKPSFENKMKDDKLCFRSGSCDSLYESEYSGSNPSSMDRCNPSVTDRYDPPSVKRAPQVASACPDRAADGQVGKQLPSHQSAPRKEDVPQQPSPKKNDALQQLAPRKEAALACVQDNVTRITVRAADQAHPRKASRRPSHTETVYYI